jgi:bifunctional UDP-N-acetylglucosamine pyrophosphorylase/glucosamine-1-phosphate N-acetyltransferase
VITKDVPPGALGVARERQRNVEGYAARREEREKSTTDHGTEAAGADVDP